MPKELTLTCRCGSFDHQWRLSKWEEDDYVLECISPFNNGIWHRIKKALRYIRKGGDLYHFDMCLNKKDVHKMKKVIDKMLCLKI